MTIMSRKQLLAIVSVESSTPKQKHQHLRSSLLCIDVVNTLLLAKELESVKSIFKEKLRRKGGSVQFTYQIQRMF